jgi:hypothetical protein
MLRAVRVTDYMVEEASVIFLTCFSILSSVSHASEQIWTSNGVNIEYTSHISSTTFRTEKAPVYPAGVTHENFTDAKQKECHKPSLDTSCGYLDPRNIFVFHVILILECNCRKIESLATKRVIKHQTSDVQHHPRYVVHFKSNWR